MGHKVFYLFYFYISNNKSLTTITIILVYVIDDIISYLLDHFFHRLHHERIEEGVMKYSQIILLAKCRKSQCREKKITLHVGSLLFEL